MNMLFKAGVCFVVIFGLPVKSQINSLDEEFSHKRVVRSNDEAIDESSKRGTENSAVSTMLIEEICNGSFIPKANASSTDNSYTKVQMLCNLLKRLTGQKSNEKMLGGDQYLPEDYNKYEAPILKNYVKLKNGKVQVIEKPVVCGVYLNIRGIVDFDEDKGRMTLDMDMILNWTDGSILKKFQNLDTEEDAIVLSPVFLKKLWTPDIYIEEVVSLEQPTIMGNSMTVVLFPQSGLVLYRSRVLITLSCDLDFKYYPADQQICTFTLKSFSYTTEKLELSWNFQNDAGVFLHQISDPNFDYQIDSITSNDTFLDIGPASDMTMMYSRLQFTLTARRKMTYQLVQTYLSSAFFIVVTWLCFLISADMFEVRVGIAMSTLLTLTAMFASVREETPKVSYVKAIDIWMLASITFIFMALAGFTIPAWIKAGLQRMHGPKDDDENSLDVLDTKKRKVLSDSQTKRRLRKYRFAKMATEQFGIYILSFAYIIFNALYWTWLMQYSKYLEWSVNPTYNKLD